MIDFDDNAQNSVWSDMMEELRFAIRCHGSTKKPRLRRRCSQCAVHHSAIGTAGTLPPASASGLEYNAGPVVPSAGGADGSSPNGLLFQSTSSGGLQSSLTDDVIHRRRTGVPRDQRDVTGDGYYTATNNRYSTATACGDITALDQRTDVTNDYYRDITNERFRNYTNDVSYNNSGKV